MLAFLASSVLHRPPQNCCSPISEPAGRDEVVRISHRRIREGSRGFALASRLFDAGTRDDASMLYAWCRHCDDEIDGQQLGMTPVAQPVRDQVASLGRLRAATLCALAGEAVADPVFIGLQRIVRQHAIPEQYVLELLAGFEMDVTSCRYGTIDETLFYCYLPAEWLIEAGIPTDDVHGPGYRTALAAVVRRLLDEADRYYHSASGSLQALGFRCAWAVATAQGVYRDIGRIVRRRKEEAWDRRAVVGTPRKIGLLCGGILDAVKAVSTDRWQGVDPRPRDLWVAPDPDPDSPQCAAQTGTW
ncbi:MAG: squalene/phytoene synthase family protein [Gammaproteobacteria bacterium]|nr:squalene/phytoene synthase family protein [Gammaproteobacteria bacterium]